MGFQIYRIIDSRAAASLAVIEQACFSHPMTETQIASLMKQETSSFFVVCEENQGIMVGSAWTQTVLDEGYIGNVGVLPEYRRQGIADALLDALENDAQERGLAFLTLEVRVSNMPAITLYEKHGYRRAGLRPSYYSDPKEDAILMTKEFEQKQI